MNAPVYVHIYFAYSDYYYFETLIQLAIAYFGKPKYSS